MVPGGAVHCVTEMCAKVATTGAGGAGFESLQGQKKSLFSETWRRGLGPTEPPVQ